jgi:tetratricopeptide (TPR) repeat protein
VQKKIPGRTPESKKSAGQTCPNCQALVHDGDIICVGCGTNLLTGQKIAEEKTRVAREPRNWKPLVALAGVVLVLAAVGAVFAFYVFTRNPVERAVQLAYNGNLLEAGNVLSKYIESHPEDGRAHFELGRVQWKMGRMTEAAAAFESAFQNEDSTADAGMLAVVAYGSSTEPSARQRQVGILRELTQRFPDNGSAWYLLALALGAENDVSGQIEALKQAVAVGEDTAGVHRSMAVALGLNGDFETAEKELSAAAGSDDADGNTAAAAGFLASLAGENYEMARAQLEAAIKADTGVKTQALTRLGMLLLAEGRTAEAAPYLTEAAERDKRNALTQFFYAAALEAEGKVLEALTVLEAVSKTSDPLAGEAAVRAASLYLGQGNYEKARECISRAENASMNTAAFHTTRGRVFLATGETARAAESFAKARQVDPLYAGAYLEMGLLHIRNQEFRAAIEQLDKYLELAGVGNAGARTEEVAALVEQLKQTGAEAVAGRSM